MLSQGIREEMGNVAEPMPTIASYADTLTVTSGLDLAYRRSSSTRKSFGEFILDAGPAAYQDERRMPDQFALSPHTKVSSPSMDRYPGPF